MHLCMITEYFPESEAGELRGGVEARTFHLAQQLAERHTVTVITSYESGSRRTHAIGKVRVIRCGKLPYTHAGAILSRLRFARTVLRTYAQLRDDSPDIVEGENFVCYLPAFSLARKLSAKAVATYHECWIGAWLKNKGILTGTLGSLWERIALRKPWDAIIAVSSATKHQLVAAGIPPAKVAVIPNGVQLADYPTPELMPAKYPKPTLCCIARLTKAKHVDHILRAVAELTIVHPDLQLKVLGVGAEERALRALAEDIGIAHHVEFLGFFPAHAAVVEVLARSHVFCSASTVEGFGIAVLEAMACGTPYVCTRIPAHQEITANGVGGLLYAPGNVHDLAEKIHFLLTRDAEYRKRAAQGRAHAQRYAWEHITGQLESLYAGLR